MLPELTAAMGEKFPGHKPAAGAWWQKATTRGDNKKRSPDARPIVIGAAEVSAAIHSPTRPGANG